MIAGIVIALGYLLFTAFDLYGNNKGFNTSREVLLRIVIPLMVALIWSLVFFDFFVWLIIPGPLMIFMMRFYADFRLDAIGFAYQKTKVLVTKKFGENISVYQARIYEDKRASVDKKQLVEILKKSKEDLEDKIKKKKLKDDDKYKKKLDAIEEKIDNWKNFNIFVLYHFGYSSVVPREYKKWYYITKSDPYAKVLIAGLVEIGTSLEYQTNFREYIAFDGGLSNSFLESMEQFKKGLKDVISIPSVEKVFALEQQLATARKARKELESQLIEMNSDMVAQKYKQTGNLSLNKNDSSLAYSYSGNRSGSLSNDSLKYVLYAIFGVLFMLTVVLIIFLLF